MELNRAFNLYYVLLKSPALLFEGLIQRFNEPVTKWWGTSYVSCGLLKICDNIVD